MSKFWVCAVVLISLDLSAFECIKNPYGDPLVWQNTQIKYCFDESVPIFIRESAKSAMQEWSDATNGVVTFVHSPKRLVRGRDTGIVFTFFKDGWIGSECCYAITLSDADHFYQMALVNINGTFHWGRRGDVGVSNVPRQKVNIDAAILHEMGHALGLAHANQNPLWRLNPADPPIMAVPVLDGHLSSDDLAGIHFLYGDGTKAVAANRLSATDAK